MWRRCRVFSCGCLLAVFGFFFFQAEDGIRDGRVTGVQTCALPISSSDRYSRMTSSRLLSSGTGGPKTRSEERRVGEECRSRWAADHLKKKKKITKDEELRNKKKNQVIRSEQLSRAQALSTVCRGSR